MAHLESRGSGGEEAVVGVPIEGGDGALDGLLDVLGHPPVVLGVKVADGDEAGPAPHREFVLRGAPLDAGGGAVDSQQHQRVLPLAIGLR